MPRPILPPRNAIIIRASDAQAIAYREQMTPMIRELAAEIHHEVMSIYRPWIKLQRKQVVGDAGIVDMLMGAFRRLRDRWFHRVSDDGQRVAAGFVEKVDDGVRLSFVRGVRDKIGPEEAKDVQTGALGAAPKRLSGKALDTALDAAVAENVGLIRSIPEQYLAQVERDVLLAVQEGWPIGQLSETLQDRYGITKRRADLIARDQCAKVTETMKAKRAVSAGFTEACWWHSSGSRFPRKSHQEANGKRYLIAEGCEIDGEKIHPGQKINCKCFCTFIPPGQ